MKRFAMLIVMSLVVSLLTANPVSLADAVRVAGHFWRSSLHGKGELRPVAWQYGEIYLFIGEQGGFVMVSADDCARPIIAYSLNNTIFPDKLPVPLAERMEVAARWISEGARQQVRATAKDADAWQKLLMEAPCKGTKGNRVGPLLETEWHQDGGYALLTPDHTPTGCAATAQAQMMRYWNYPAFGYGRETYNCPPYGAQSADFSHTLYDWANMPSHVTTSSPYSEQLAVSTLMYHVGVSLHMGYADGGSGAAGLAGQPGVPSIDNSLKDYFYYNKQMRPIFKISGYTDQRWADSLVAELDLLHPIVYCGVAPQGGHGFVCDGYEYRDGQVWFHFNFGWSGNGDGYYTTDDICPNVSPTGQVGNVYHFNQSNQALLGAVPDYKMHVSDTLLSFTRDGGVEQLWFSSIATSDQPWSVSVDQPWVSVESHDVTHVGAIGVSVDENTLGDERYATVTFTQAGERILVRVVQTHYSEEDYCPLTVVMENTQNGGWEGGAYLSFESASGYVYNTASLSSGSYDSVTVGVPPQKVNALFHSGGGTDRYVNYRIYNQYAEKLVDVEYAFLNGGSHPLDAPCDPLTSSLLPTDTTVLKTELYDFIGRLLYTTPGPIPLNEMPSGLYILRTFTDKETISRKYMKP